MIDKKVTRRILKEIYGNIAETEVFYANDISAEFIFRDCSFIYNVIRGPYIKMDGVKMRMDGEGLKNSLNKLIKNLRKLKNKRDSESAINAIFKRETEEIDHGQD